VGKFQSLLRWIGPVNSLGPRRPPPRPRRRPGRPGPAAKSAGQSVRTGRRLPQADGGQTAHSDRLESRTPSSQLRDYRPQVNHDPIKMTYVLFSASPSRFPRPVPFSASVFRVCAGLIGSREQRSPLRKRASESAIPFHRLPLQSGEPGRSTERGVKLSAIRHPFLSAIRHHAASPLRMANGRPRLSTRPWTIRKSESGARSGLAPRMHGG
jgi:hypothetical protein